MSYKDKDTYFPNNFILLLFDSENSDYLRRNYVLYLLNVVELGLVMWGYSIIWDWLHVTD